MAFEGFYPETVGFFDNLVKNNNRDWFNAHKDEYEKYVLTPAKEYIKEVGVELKKLSPNIIAEPFVDKSIFRIYRDARFAKGAPYKTHLGVFFWEGSRVKKDCPGLYFHFDKDETYLALGYYFFPKDVITNFREMMSNEKKARELKEIIDNLGLPYGQKKYKITPRGFSCEGDIGKELILYSGIYVWENFDFHELTFNKGLVDLTVEFFKKTLPLHKWIMMNLEPISRS